MATAAVQPLNTNSNLFMNPQGPSPPEPYRYGSGAYHPAPMAPLSPSSSVSPTNYHNHNVRQLRQPRQPMYIPAALRPTDFPTRPTDIPNRPRAPDTPPTSKDSSFDSGNLSSPSTSTVNMLLNSSFEDDSQLRRGLSMAISESWAEEEAGEITGPPTTAHWKPDVSSSQCYVCHGQFTWYFRRHHCRRCGHLICDNHIKHLVPLDQNARFHSKGHPSKACRACFEEWKVLKKLRDSRSSSVADLSASPPGSALPIPRPQRLAEEPRVGSMARSEGGMDWSTF